MRYTSLKKFVKKMEKIEKKTHFVRFLQNSKSYVISLHVLEKKACFLLKKRQQQRLWAKKAKKVPLGPPLSVAAR